MAWDMEYDAAMADARRQGIPHDDAAKLWTEYTRLGALVRAGELSDPDALDQFGKYGAKLGALRAGLDLLSPDLDVITGKRR